MPSKRAILEHFSRDELVAVVDCFDRSVTDRRVKDPLIEAVGGSKRATLADVLPEPSPRRGGCQSGDRRRGLSNKFRE